jgi:hypothetical protein
MFGKVSSRVQDLHPMWLKIWIICLSFPIVSVRPARAADLSAVFTQDNLSVNAVMVGEVKQNRSVLSLPALVQALGPPSRSQVKGGTRRISWDEAGIQLEATAQESTPFALFFEFGGANAENQGVVPSGQYEGTLDCLGIKLHPSVQIAEVKSPLASAGFNHESGSTAAESWSVRLEHWTAFLRFSANGELDSAVIRILPDLF